MTTDRVVQIYDESGDKKDKFSTKPADPAGPKNFVVRGMAFSPDSIKLAIAQSDNIVFVYKLGETGCGVSPLEWKDKKSICNKFLQHSPITAMTWPKNRKNELVFGLSEGKVKVGQLKSNKSGTLYAHPDGAYCVSLASSPDGSAVCSGHVDGSIWLFNFDDGSGARLCTHTCVPYALSWGNGILAAGADKKIAFYNEHNNAVPQVFDYAADDAVREFSSAAFNPTGETVVVGSFNSFRTYTYNAHRGTWEEAGVKTVENLYTVTAMGWKPDGSRLAVGALCGNVDLYDACMRRQRYKGKFEFTYVSKSNVIVKRLSTGMKIALKSHFGYEVSKINIYPDRFKQDRFLVAHTTDTLLVGDLELCKMSEVPWNGTGQERFDFETERVCVVHNAGELSIVEYGRNEVLGTCRTSHTAPNLLSVSVNESRADLGRPENKKIAYLVDLQTVRIMDLGGGEGGAGMTDVATINHVSKIDWLSLNLRATHLLFRDKKRQLHLFDIKNQQRHTLLNYCSYVNWVPSSDVVVAQNRGNLCVWYSVESPDRVCNIPIKGEVDDIERRGGKTEVLVDEGVNVRSYLLDEELIMFNSLLEDRDYDAAVEVLEPLELTPETEAMWKELQNAALEDKQLVVAQRCSAALGDIAKAQFLGAINADAKRAAAAEGGGNGLNNYAVKARLAMMDKQWKVAEGLLLENGQTDAAIQMYRDMQRLDQAVAVAASRQHESAENLRREHLEWLKATGQEEAAGAVKEEEGDYLSAIRFYLKGGLPGRAAAVVVRNNARSPFDQSTIEEIAQALKRAEMYERAGELYDALDRTGEAKDAYVRGHAYRRAVELCRRPGSNLQHEVVELEEKWGDHLVEMKQVDAAINHFIEAGQSVKAIEAAMECRNWKKALEIVDAQAGGGSRSGQQFQPYYRRIARHYEQARDYEQAERCFLRAGQPGEAVEMYCRADRWESAHKVAVGYMTDAEAALLYTKRARELEANQRYKEAEKMYLTVKEHDLAINMYKKNRMYDQMLRLVSTFRKDLLGETHLHLAQQLEGDHNFREAERMYLEAKEWKSVVQMYRANEMWEDAIRVAKTHGGANASKQVAYAWAVSLGGEAGANLLKKFGLLEQAIDYAMESGAFTHAFELTRIGLKSKLPDVHLKYAMFLEDEGRFADAEAEFVKADKPKEAIDMYVHQQDWVGAMRVAENYDPTSVLDIQLAQAKVCIERKEWSKAEAMYLKAKRPEQAIRMYQEYKMWEQALRVAEDYLPSKVQEIHLEIQAQAGGSGRASTGGGGGHGGNGGFECVTRARQLEREGQYAAAVDAYLELTANHTSDHDALETAWGGAVKLAMANVPGRVRSVVQEVGRRLTEIGRERQAQQLYDSLGMTPPSAGEPHRGGGGGGSSGVPSGAPPSAAAVEEAARRGDWATVHDMAERMGPDVAAQYAVKHATMEHRSGNSEVAADILSKYGAPPNPAFFALYKEIAAAVLAGQQDGYGEVELKDFLLKLVDTMSATPEINSVALTELSRYLEAGHLALVRAKAKDAGLLDISARAATSLLRYVGELPADRAFFEAGIACREAGMDNMAFVFLNRYLDLTELMDDPDADGDASQLENADFVDTDIPYDFILPEKHFVQEATREEVRDWVLALSMDQQVDQSLSTRTCGSCGRDTYVAALTCHKCKAKAEQCVVTGFPVLAGERVMHEGRPARKEDWNKWCSKLQIDPWSGLPAQPKY